MIDWTFLEMIPPEQLSILITAIVGALVSIVTAIGVGLGWLIRTLFKRQSRKTELELEAYKQELDEKKKAIEAKQLERDREWQLRSEEQRRHQETIRLFISQGDLDRKDNAEQRKHFYEHLEAMSKAQTDNVEINRNLVTTNAAILEMLKHTKENGEIVLIRQQNIQDSQEDTHKKINEIAANIIAVREKLDTVAVGRASDRGVLDEIKIALDNLSQGVRRLEDTTQPIPSLIESMKVSVANAAPQSETTIEKKEETQ